MGFNSGFKGLTLLNKLLLETAFLKVFYERREILCCVLSFFLSFFPVIPRRLNFVCQRCFGTFCLFRNIGTENSEEVESPKRKNTTFITRRKFEITNKSYGDCTSLNYTKLIFLPVKYVSSDTVHLTYILIKTTSGRIPKNACSLKGL